ncbi:MAG: MATE family efflux transporter [Stagnimonas sp.]|nr:MATE family efflux transporter [Stagnimonas sp.]
MFSPRLRTEMRANLKLALPLIAAQLAGVGMGATDTIMAGKLGPNALAAVAVSVNISMAFFVFFLGVFMAASAIVSQRRGAGVAPETIGSYARTLQGMALWMGAIWCLSLQLIASPAIRALDLDAETTALAIPYLRAYAFSAFGLCSWFALRFVAEGLEATRPVMLAGLIGLIVNALLNWLLIFGAGPVPALGVTGSGIATAIACVVMAASLAAFYGRNPRLSALRVFKGHGRETGAVGETLKLGLPIALIVLAEAGLFVVVAMFMARLGERTVAAYQIAINFASVVFMIPLGIGFATTVRVGFFAGAGDALSARYAGLVGMGMGMSNAAFNATVMLVFGGVIAALYTQDVGIAAQAMAFLALAAIFQLADGLQATVNGALRGLKDTRLPMVITLFSYWCIGLPVAWWLCFHTPLGANGLWWGLTAGLAAAAVGLTLRFQGLTRR